MVVFRVPRRNVLLTFIIVFLPLVIAMFAFLFFSIMFPAERWKYGIPVILLAAIIEIPYIKLYLWLTQRIRAKVRATDKN